MRILLVEDDSKLSENISLFLKRESYAVDCALTAQEANEKLENNEYDVIVMDWKLPDGSGVEICKELRSNSIQTPVIMLTAKSQLEDKIEGLNAGADDYLTKPFEIKELTARIRALGRRNSTVNLPIIVVDNLEINSNLKQVSRGGKLVELSPREYALLEYLALKKGQSISRVELLSHVWDENANLFSNTVDVHIKYLRNKIDEGFDKKLILTIKGEGYALCES